MKSEACLLVVKSLPPTQRHDIVERALELRDGPYPCMSNARFGQVADHMACPSRILLFRASGSVGKIASCHMENLEPPLPVAKP